MASYYEISAVEDVEHLEKDDGIICDQCGCLNDVQMIFEYQTLCNPCKIPCPYSVFAKIIKGMIRRVD